jgi:hypothetical protein
MMDAMFVGVHAINDTPSTLLCGEAAEGGENPERQLCQFEPSPIYFALADEGDNGS